MIGEMLKSTFSKTGGSGKRNMSDLMNNSSDDVNEEYKEAFRTKSYIEMWSKVQQHQLGNSSLEKFSSSSSSSNSNSSLPDVHHLSDLLLEPKEETLKDIMESFKIDQLLTDYFKSSIEACNVCEFILQSIHQIRANYRKIKRVIKASKNPKYGFGVIFKELAGFVMLQNPLASITPKKYGEIHDTNMDLLHKLTSKQKRVKRKSNLQRISKKIRSFGFVASHSALVVALLVLAFHSMIGVIAVPGIIACSLAFYKKKIRSGGPGRDESSLIDRFSSQLDIAAKGTFILINDLDTMSRLVWRLYDEIEHLKVIANTCVRNGKSEVLKEVVKEFQANESSFLEQLEELEGHVYLCFHTINRSRRRVIEKIIGTQLETN